MKLNYIEVSDITRGEYFHDILVTKKYAEFWRIAKIVGIEQYNLKGGHRFFKSSELAKAELIGKLVELV